MGNQMFQYAFGRIIAEKKGYQLECRNHNEAANPSVVQKYFPNAIPVRQGIQITNNQLSCGYACPQPHNLFQHIDMEKVLTHNGMVFLYGYWQKHWYYPPHIDQIKTWFDYDSSTHMKPDPNDIVVHFRLGDIIEEGRNLSPKIFIDRIKEMEYDRCIIVSDTPESPILNKFSCLKNVFISEGSLMEDFTLMKYSRRLFISQSTLSWWAAFLGDQETVYAPLYLSPPHPNAWNSNPSIDDIDLVPDNRKYVKIQI